MNKSVLISSKYFKKGSSWWILWGYLAVLLGCYIYVQLSPTSAEKRKYARAMQHVQYMHELDSIASFNEGVKQEQEEMFGKFDTTEYTAGGKTMVIVTHTQNVNGKTVIDQQSYEKK